MVAAKWSETSMLVVDMLFWNFDALFRSKQRPARDSHDTFFLKAPAAAKQLPEDYLEKVKQVHQTGGYGSKGYDYDCKQNETDKNMLRIHTTAASTKCCTSLHKRNFLLLRDAIPLTMFSTMKLWTELILLTSI